MVGELYSCASRGRGRQASMASRNGPGELQVSSHQSQSPELGIYGRLDIVDANIVL